MNLHNISCKKADGPISPGLFGKTSTVAIQVQHLIHKSDRLQIRDVLNLALQQRLYFFSQIFVCVSAATSAFFLKQASKLGVSPKNPRFYGFFFHISPKIPSSVSVMIWCRTIKLDIFGVWADMRREAHARRVDPQFGQQGKPVGERNGGFQKWWYPQIIHFNRDFHYKPSILGYPYFWKHPNGSISLSPKETRMTHTQ